MKLILSLLFYSFSLMGAVPESFIFLSESTIPLAFKESGSFIQEQFEFEVDDRLFAERVSEGYYSSTFVGTRLPKKFYLSTDIELVVDRSIRGGFDPLSVTEKGYSVSSRGLKKTSVSVLKVYPLKKDLINGFSVSYSPGTFTRYLSEQLGGENLKNGGHDFAITYLWKHDVNEWTIGGDITAGFEDEKKSLEPNSNNILIDSPTGTFGISFLSALQASDNFIIKFEPSFALYSQRNFENPGLSVATDKGFFYGAEISFLYRLNNRLDLSFDLLRSSKVHNVRGFATHKTVDYEIETDSYQLSLTYAY